MRDEIGTSSIHTDSPHNDKGPASKASNKLQNGSQYVFFIATTRAIVFIQPTNDDCLRHHPCDVEYCVLGDIARRRRASHHRKTSHNFRIWTGSKRPTDHTDLQTLRKQIAHLFVLENSTEINLYTMPCLSIPGANLARCGTLRPVPFSSASSPNSVNHSESGHSAGQGRAVHGAPAASHSDTTSIPADRPVLPSSISGGVPNSSANGSANGSITSTRCASPIQAQAQEAHANNNQNRQQQRAAITDILAMSPSRITRPQIQLVEASLPMLDNLIPPNLLSRSNNNLCPPMMHSWMSKCADGALGRDVSAERMCLEVRKTFGACSHGLTGGASL